jgi:SHS2 domain-containing protein
MQENGFEEIEHTADWALRVRGRDLKELLVNAARGMNHLLVADLAEIPVEVEETVELEAIDAESMLVNWLSELAYWAEMEQVIFSEFDLRQATPTHLKAIIRGGQVPQLQKHIKAVTYHGLEITTTADGITATIVFDV